MRWDTPGSPLGSPSSDAASQNTPVDVLGGRYLVLERKRGGMSDVYICHPNDDPELKIAFKTFREDLTFDRSTRLAFLREVSIWMRISGLPHIMPTFGLEVFNGRPHIRMPAVLGVATVRDALNLDRRMPKPIVHLLAFQVAYGMAAARRHLSGLVHGDLKPENLFFKEVGTLLISDFGMSRVSGENYSLRLDSSWPYQAPECWSGEEHFTESSDIYAFGVIVYEMLTRSLPFRATGRSEWMTAHREKEPVAPSGYADEPLMHLSLGCLAKDPRRRPATFLDVLAELDSIAGPVDALNMHLKSNSLFQEHEKFQKQVRPLMVRALARIGEKRLALSELDAMSDDLRDSAYWAMRGSVVAQLHRHEEALECFDRALKECATDDRYEWESERALSLKRLGRTDEAIAVYHRLLHEVPEHLVSHVVENLASVHLVRQEPNAVIRLLRPLTRDKPESDVGWGNLGEAYRQLNQFVKAEDCMRRAIAANPNDEHTRARLAVEVLLRGMARVDDALSLLEDGFSRGDQSARLITGMLTCYYIRQMDEELRGIVAWLKQHVSAETTERLFKDSQALALAVAETARAGPPPAIEEDISLPGDQANAALREAFNVIAGVSRSDSRLPNSTIRLEGYAFSFNYYDDVASPEYLPTFLRLWRAVTRTLKYRLPARPPRSNPFYFTQCPGCRTAILTNRDPGADLQCLVCETRSTTGAFASSVTDALLPKIHESLGKHLIDLSGKTVLLLVQPRDEDQGRVIGEICRRAGFATEGNDAYEYDVRRVQFGGIQTGGIQTGRDFAVWAKVCGPGSLAYHEDAPPEIERLRLHVDARCGAFASFSTVASPSGVSAYEEVFRKGVRQNPEDAISLRGLVEILLTQQRYDDAVAHALAGVRRWPEDARMWSNLARIDQGRHQYGDAVAHAERALGLDPTEQRALVVLVMAHRALGNVEAERAAMARLSNLGLG